MNNTCSAEIKEYNQGCGTSYRNPIRTLEEAKRTARQRLEWQRRAFDLGILQDNRTYGQRKQDELNLKSFS